MLTQIFKLLHEKLSTKLLIILIVIIICFVSGAVFLIIHFNIPISFKGMTIGTPNDYVACQDISDLIPSAICKSKDKALDIIREKFKRAEEYDEFEEKPIFSLMKLELLIEKNGGSINTYVEHNNGNIAYTTIQKCLQLIDYYNGPITGEQKSTNIALIKFQTAYNMKVPESQRLQNLGYCGYGTLNALRRNILKIYNDNGKFFKTE